MNTITISQKQKFKHLSDQSIIYIISRVLDFDKLNPHKKRNIGKTAFLNQLASDVGTSLSNIYNIINACTVTLKDTYYNEYQSLSADALLMKRRSYKAPNNCKLDTASDFITHVTSLVLDNSSLASIDEARNTLLLDFPDIYNSDNSVATSTLYNYIHHFKIGIKPIDLPRMTSWKPKPKDKQYLAKRQKGVSIDERPISIDTREEFGHWEGDLVTGPRDGKRGAYFTLIERKTRFYIMIPIKSKSADNVYRAVNRLHKYYGDKFKDIFKSITFDNGNEFARWKDIEIKKGSKEKRTTVYFAHPYCSSERGSNENCNGLIRRFIKKGTDINTISKAKTLLINKAINEKRRKIHQYQSSKELFKNELIKLGLTNKYFFYQDN